MFPNIVIKQSPLSVLEKSGHTLLVMPEKAVAGLPLAELLAARMKRKGMKYAELAKKPLLADTPHGGQAAWVALGNASAFEQHAALREALALLLEESPETLTIVLCDEAHALPHARMALYVALVNAVRLPDRKKKPAAKTLRKIQLAGLAQAADFSDVQAVAAGNALARCLTVLPPNDLTPSIYRQKIRALAAENGWEHEEFDLKKLRKMGAGAFVAVAQGSDPQDAAIVHLAYTPKKPHKTVALVGKGICFDTGGHNLKPARYMHGMHEDMNGSAVALGILLAATQAQLPIKIDCWLAIAQNHIGPQAYKQNDVVTALNGMTIEVVHTDAEGRMVLADTLTLASRAKPDVLLDFATLTGSMITALGNRYSGIMGNRPELLCKAVGAGQACGERVNAFPLDSDYDEALESKVADIKQCTLDGEADHILAARFLSRFIEGEVPWLHVDLAASNCKGGLGAVGSDVTGFGVAFTVVLLEKL